MVACHSDEEDLFGNNGSIIGIVQFDNLLTGEIQNASNAAIQLSRYQSDPSYPIQTNTDGKFRIDNLKGKNYLLQITLPQSFTNTFVKNITYNQLSNISNLGKSEVRDLGVIKLKWDSTNTKAAFLRVSVVDTSKSDINGYRLAGFKVCLYTNQEYAKGNKNCEGSIDWAITNSQGFVLFTDLEEKAYVLKTEGNIGSIKLSNPELGTATQKLNKSTLNKEILKL
jgi:hypothetical protein